MGASDEHKGHRSRVKKKFLDNGLENFELHEALELYLYYALPRVDTNAIAHRLINSVGSFSAVFDAPIDVLKSAGISENTAVLLKLLPELSRLYTVDKASNPNKIIDLDHPEDYLLNEFIGRMDVENCVLLLTDAKCKMLFKGIVNKGSIHQTVLPTRKIVDLAIRYNARNAVIAHNHPSGVALPSKEDIEVTKSLYFNLKNIGVNLIDHLVVVENDFVSILQSLREETIITYPDEND